MRMKIFGGLMALALATSFGCNKKKDEDTKAAPKTTTTSSSATMTKPAAPTPSSGATMAPATSGAESGAAMAPAGSAAGIPDAEFSKAMDVIGGMADIADKDKGNCDKMADDLSKYMDDKKADLEHFKTMKNSGAKPSPEQMQKMQAPMMKMMPAMMSCQSNAKMQDLGKKMGGAM